VIIKTEKVFMRMEKFTNIIELDKVDSTNTYMKKYSRHIDQDTVLFSAEQTDGKGRLGRNWYGKKGKSIFSSFLIRNVFDNSDAVRLSFMFSIAVKMMLSKYLDHSKIILKWPNDIIVSGKKICGILSEYSKECVITGIGINVLNFIPDGEIGYPYTTMESESGIVFDIEKIKSELVKSVNQVFTRYCTNCTKDIPLIWFREAGIKGMPVTVSQKDKMIKGHIDSIDELGSLIVKNSTGGKKEKIFYGDVTYND